MCLSVFVFSADLVPAFGLRKDSAHAPALEWLTAVGFTMLTSKATLPGWKGLPPDLSVCVFAVAFQVRRGAHIFFCLRRHRGRPAKRHGAAPATSMKFRGALSSIVQTAPCHRLGGAAQDSEAASHESTLHPLSRSRRAVAPAPDSESESPEAAIVPADCVPRLRTARVLVR